MMKGFLAFTVVLVVAMRCGAAEEPLPAGAVRSTGEHGTITLLPDEGLSGGRLLVRIVAMNLGGTDALLEAQDVAITTAGGSGVHLVPLVRLEEEARAAARSANAGGFQPQQGTRNANAAIRSSAGTEMEGAYGGASGGPSSVEQAVGAAQLERSNPALAQQVQALRAGILQALTVPPGKAAGAQFVTERLRFGRKEPRTLVVVVHFNGDQHRIELPVPPEGGH